MHTPALRSVLTAGPIARSAAKEASAQLPFWQNERVGWIAWVGLFVYLGIAILLGSDHSVVPYYAKAGAHWIAGQPLYDGTGVGFIYLPQAAILHVPFSLLPRIPAEILWRGLTIAIFASGMRQLVALAETETKPSLFPLATFIAIPLAFSAARNGQSTLLIAGLVMQAMHELTLQRWNRATVLFCLAVSFKPICFPFLTIVFGLYRPIRWRLLVGLPLVALAPFLSQSPGYVVDQYRASVDSFRIAAALGEATPWSQLFGLLEILGMHVSASGRLWLRIVAALGTLGINLVFVRRLPARRALLHLFTSTTAYVLLFNPRTENNTYALLAPVIGLACAESFLCRRSARRTILYVVAAMAMLGGYEVGIRIAPQVPPVWLTPLTAIAFLGLWSVDVWGEVFERNGRPSLDLRLAMPRL